MVWDIPGASWGVASQLFVHPQHPLSGAASEAEKALTVLALLTNNKKISIMSIVFSTTNKPQPHASY